MAISSAVHAVHRGPEVGENPAGSAQTAINLEALRLTFSGLISMCTLCDGRVSGGTGRKREK